MAANFSEFLATSAPELLQVRSEQRITNSKASRGLGFTALVVSGSKWLEGYLRESLHIDGVSSRLEELAPQAGIESPLLGLYLPRGKFQILPGDGSNGELYGAQIGFWNVGEGTDRHDIKLTPEVVISESYVSEILGAHGEYWTHPNPSLLANEAVISATINAF